MSHRFLRPICVDIPILFLVAFVTLLPATCFAQDFLDLKIPVYKVTNGTMKEALIELHAWGIQVCFEKTSLQATNEAMEEVKISVELLNASVRDILNSITSADTGYTWERYRRFHHATNLINVFPAGAEEGDSSLMNIRAKKLIIEGLDTPENSIQHISFRIPELVRKLYPGGVAGSLLGSAGDGPVTIRVRFEFKKMTVRQILNELALRSIGKGWIYEFKASRDDPEPRHTWRVFP